MKRFMFMAALAALVFTSCDKNNLPEPIKEIITYIGTQAPGDVWTWEINKTDKTMTATWDYGTFDDTSDDISVTGNYEVLPSGFMKVVLTSSSPASAEIPTDGTAYFYALELPGLSMIVKPEGSIKGDIISMVATGECSNIPGDYHYFFTAPGKGELYNSYTDEAYGHATFTDITGKYAITGERSSLDCLDGVNCTVTGAIEGIPSAICGENGAVVIQDGTGATTAEGQFTEAGIFMLDMGKGNGGIFGLKADATVTAADFKNVAFNGIVYMPANQDTKTLPVKLEFDGAGVGAGYPYSDIENNEVDAVEGISISIDAIDNGFVTGTNTFTGGDTSFAGSLLKYNGKSIFVMISTSAEVGNPPFILILTSI